MCLFTEVADGFVDSVFQSPAFKQQYARSSFGTFPRHIPATWLPSLTSICGPVTVTQVGEQPSAPDRTLLQLSTRQAYINTIGVIVSQQTIEQTRRMVRGTDGRWLVDTQVQAG